MQENDEQLYKWLVGDKISPVQNLKWPVGVGEWTQNVNPVICRSGWHGMVERNVLEHLPQEKATLWVVEIDGKRVDDENKFAATRMKLVRPIGLADDRRLRLFAADCAEDVLPIFYKIRPNDDRPAKAIKVARRFANGEATSDERAAAWAAAEAASRDAAGDAAWAAAWDAAWDAAWAAAGAAAGDAARAAARDAAWAAAWAAAEAAARAAARDAAGDAAGAAAGDAARDAAWAKYSNWLIVRLESDF
jgi:hypothetical protein